MQLSHQRKGGGGRWPAVRAQGRRRRQYHGKGPHRKGSIALSQVVEGGDEGGWRAEASEDSQEVAPCQSQEMPFFCTDCQPARLSGTAAIREEPGGETGCRHEGI